MDEDQPPTNFQPESTSARQFTRRDFLKLATGVVVGTLLSQKDTLVEDLKYLESLQERYGIEIRTLKQVYEEAARTQEYQSDRDFMVQRGLPERWDHARLKMLDDYLAVLPPHFYAPDENGRALRITLGWVSGARENPIPNSGDNRTYTTHQIEISSISHFFPHSRFAFPKLTHELIHVITPGTFIRQGKDVNLTSLWDKEMSKILGGNFVTVYDRYAQKAIKISTNLPTDQQDILTDMLYGLQASSAGFTGKSFIEWYPVLGEHYLLGKNKFHDAYNRVFSSDQTFQLYEFTKSKVFREIEFRNLMERK